MKKILTLVLSIILVLSSLVCAFASEADVDSEEQEIRNKLESLGYEIISITKSEENTNQRNNSKYSVSEEQLYFDSVDEFIDFAEQLDNAASYESTIVDNEIDSSTSNNMIQSTTINGIGKTSKYTPFLALNGVFCWQNINFNFEAEWYPLARYYTLVPGSVENINSYLSGLIGVNWYQTNAIANYTDSTRLTTEIQVVGYYLFGVRIGGYDIGTKKGGSWTHTSKNINKYL